MNANARQKKILQVLASRDGATVESLATLLDVSGMTVRRDLAQLERAGRIRRTHGGATLSLVGVVEFSFREKESVRRAEKRAIARAIAALVKPGMAISLDTGTTTLETARAIAGISGLTVLTTSLAITSALYASENIDLILLGGTVRRNSPDLSGPLAESNVKNFRTHLAIVGADAATPDGAFTTDVGIARVSQALAASANSVVLAVDSSKFMQTALVRHLDFSQIHQVVTDEGCPASVREWLDQAGPAVTYVPVPGKPALAAETAPDVKLAV